MTRYTFPKVKSLYRRQFLKLSDGGPSIDWNSIVRRNSALNPIDLSTPGFKPFDANAATLTSNHTVGIPGLNPSPAGSSGWQKVFDTAASVGNGVAPYVSNIVNSFRRPPYPKAPIGVNPITLPKVSLDNSRNQVERSTRAADVAATRDLDSNTAAAVRTGNLATKIQGLNQVNEQEANINANQAAQAAGMNLNVDAMNAGAMNNYYNDMTARSIANQRAQSENLANATDKYIAIGNQKAQRQLDLQKMGVLSEIWKQSGVWNRMMKNLESEGKISPEYKRLGGMMKVFAQGGPMRVILAEGGPGPGVPTYKTQAEVDAANASVRSLAARKGLINPESMYVARKPGDPMVPYVDENGRPITDAGTTQFPVGTKMTLGEVPNDVKDLQWDTSKNLPYYLDPHTDDMQYVHPSIFYSSRFNPNRGKVNQPVAKMADGGGIHIKPSHRGRFTAYLKSHHTTLSAALHSSSAHVRQMANFARNAKKWHHADGGRLKPVY